MDAFRPRSFRVAFHPQIGKSIADLERRVQHLCEGRARDRVQVKVQIVGTVHIIAFGIPLIQIDASQVDDPQEAGEIVDDREVDDVAGAMFDGAYVYPVRFTRRGRAS